MFAFKKIFPLLLFQLLTHGVSSNILLQMPDVKPQVETNLCRAYTINETNYIVGFKPEVKSSDQAHHMIIYSCTKPGFTDTVWDCGEMSSETESKSSYVSGPVCYDEHIIYAWAMDAPALDLPEDVSFRIGDDNGSKYLVLQVHYKDVAVFLNSENGDSSGVELKTTYTQTSKLAGIKLIYSPDGLIPPGKTELKASCVYEENPVLHPFAFRVHAHKHGVEIVGKVIKNGQPIILGLRSPQLPQMFQPIDDKGITIEKGDTLSAVCYMSNKESKTYQIGATASDEMCNFYIMYWVDEAQLPKAYLCPDPYQTAMTDEYFRQALDNFNEMDDVGRDLFGQDNEALMGEANFDRDFKLPSMSLLRQQDMDMPFREQNLDPFWLTEGQEKLDDVVKAVNRPIVHSEFKSMSQQSAYENGKEKFFNRNSQHNKYSNVDDDDDDDDAGDDGEVKDRDHKRYTYEYYN